MCVRMYVCVYEYEGAGKPAARHAQLCECVGFLRIVVCAAGGQVRGVSRHACREFLCSRLQGWVLHAEALYAWRAQQYIPFPSPRSERQAQQSPTIAGSAIYTISIAAFREASPTKPHHEPPTVGPYTGRHAGTVEVRPGGRIPWQCYTVTGEQTRNCEGERSRETCGGRDRRDRSQADRQSDTQTVWYAAARMGLDTDRTGRDRKGRTGKADKTESERAGSERAGRDRVRVSET